MELTNETTERPIFRPTGYRPPRDEQWEMKQAVIARDGLTTCFWCREPFESEQAATLEHIMPLADGGRHDLRNCTLACERCNTRNVPRVVLAQRISAIVSRENRVQINRAFNGGEPTDCPPEVFSRFEAIARSRNGKLLDHASATHLLKNLHAQYGWPRPSLPERRVFKGHFNRWLTAQQSKTL